MKTPRTPVLKASLLTTPDGSRAIMQTVRNIFVGTMTKSSDEVCSLCVHPLRAFLLSESPAPPPHSLLVEQETHQPQNKKRNANSLMYLQ